MNINKYKYLKYKYKYVYLKQTGGTRINLKRIENPDKFEWQKFEDNKWIDINKSKNRGFIANFEKLVDPIDHENNKDFVSYNNIKKHIVNLPYTWQYSSNNEWIDMDPINNDILENNYKDKTQKNEVLYNYKINDIHTETPYLTKNLENGKIPLLPSNIPLFGDTDEKKKNNIRLLL
jgi:hypothetical protein